MGAVIDLLDAAHVETYQACSNISKATDGGASSLPTCLLPFGINVIIGTEVIIQIIPSHDSIVFPAVDSRENKKTQVSVLKRQLESVVEATRQLEVGVLACEGECISIDLQHVCVPGLPLIVLPD